MSKLSHDVYAEGTAYRAEYLEGREAYMECGSIQVAAENSPYLHQPHDKSKHEAFVAGVKDEQLWSLDSTGR